MSLESAQPFVQHGYESWKRDFLPPFFLSLDRQGMSDNFLYWF